LFKSVQILVRRSTLNN